MSRKTIMPEIERLKDDPISDSVERHPSYALIGANRWIGGESFLYGSDFRHAAGVTVTIRKSELHRGLSNDYAHSLGELIEVDLSEAQWATFVSTLNSGMGTQCTLRFLPGEIIPGIARGNDRKKQFKLEASEALKEAEVAAARLSELIEKGGRKTEMRDAIRTVLAAFSSQSGVSFIAKQFGEHVEKVTEHAKIEVSAYVGNAIARAGLVALKGGAPISITDEQGSADPLGEGKPRATEEKTL